MTHDCPQATIGSRRRTLELGGRDSKSERSPRAISCDWGESGRAGHLARRSGRTDGAQGPDALQARATRTRGGAFLEPAPSVSIPVGASTGQDPQDVDDPCFGVALEANPPVAYAQAPFICVRQLDDIASRWIACKSIEGAYDAALDWRVKTLEIAPRPCRENPAAAGAQATSRLISSAEITSPRVICARASRAPSSSSGVVGSSSTGARASSSARASRSLRWRTMKPSVS